MELFATYMSHWDGLSESVLKSFLDEPDLIRLAQASHPKRRRELLIGRAFIKHTLGDILGRDPHRVELTLKNGRIPCPTDASVCFSLSHSGPMILLAVAEHPIGADTEQLKNRDFDRLKRSLTPAQQQTLSLCPTPQDKAVFFTRCWTMKEAAFKLDALSGHRVSQPHFISGRLNGFLIAVAAETPLFETPVRVKASCGKETDIMILEELIVS